MRRQPWSVGPRRPGGFSGSSRGWKAGGVMAWDGLEYLKVPRWRTAFETADVIFGVDLASGQEILVFGRGALEMITVTGVEDGLRVLRVSIDGAGGELELLIAACEAYRGHHDYKSEA